MVDECGIDDRKRPTPNTCSSTSEEDILSQSPQGFF